MKIVLSGPVVTMERARRTVGIASACLNALFSRRKTYTFPLPASPTKSVLYVAAVASEVGRANFAVSWCDEPVVGSISYTIPRPTSPTINSVPALVEDERANGPCVAQICDRLCGYPALIETDRVHDARDGAGDVQPAPRGIEVEARSCGVS